MSRTYRRKGLKKEISRFRATKISLYGIIDKRYSYWEPPTEEEAIKSENIFHSDKYHSRNMPAPKEYRKYYVRRDRRIQKKALYIAFKEDDLDTVIIEHRHRHSATYDYW